MKRNLRNLASLLADPNVNVALVTGKPGTGKENLSKAIYYGNKLRQPLDFEPESIFIETTAVEIQAAMNGPDAITPSAFLLSKLPNLPGNIRPKSPFIFIDELNKAKQEFLAAMLRPLEQGESELDTDGKPKYILAASQHIDVLAKKPPQDFWTRVTHQLRVVHPLSHVSEEDGEDFLRSFFYSQWWSFIEVMIHDYKEKHANELIQVFLGKVSDGSLEPSKLCLKVKDAFENTLVPLVSRDTLSVRGARSILSQVFARLSWYVRFQKPLEDPETLDKTTDNELARLVNSAVQDVMAILNPARATPAGMEDSELNKRQSKT
jgi:hypothetical protein